MVFDGICSCKKKHQNPNIMQDNARYLCYALVDIHSVPSFYCFRKIHTQPYQRPSLAASHSGPEDWKHSWVYRVDWKSNNIESKWPKKSAPKCDPNSFGWDFCGWGFCASLRYPISTSLTEIHPFSSPHPRQSPPEVLSPVAPDRWERWQGLWWSCSCGLCIPLVLFGTWIPRMDVSKLWSHNDNIHQYSISTNCGFQ